MLVRSSSLHIKYPLYDLGHETSKLNLGANVHFQNVNNFIFTHFPVFEGVLNRPSHNLGLGLL